MSPGCHVGLSGFGSLVEKRAWLGWHSAGPGHPARPGRPGRPGHPGHSGRPGRPGLRDGHLAVRPQENHSGGICSDLLTAA